MYSTFEYLNVPFSAGHDQSYDFVSVTQKAPTHLDLHRPSFCSSTSSIRGALMPTDLFDNTQAVSTVSKGAFGSRFHCWHPPVDALVDSVHPGLSFGPPNRPSIRTAWVHTLSVNSFNSLSLTSQTICGGRIVPHCTLPSGPAGLRSCYRWGCRISPSTSHAPTLRAIELSSFSNTAWPTVSFSSLSRGTVNMSLNSSNAFPSLLFKAPDMSATRRSNTVSTVAPPPQRGVAHTR